jgi:hypothetical protein
MKEGSLFCFAVMRSTEPGDLDSKCGRLLIFKMITTAKKIQIKSRFWKEKKSVANMVTFRKFNNNNNKII